MNDGGSFFKAIAAVSIKCVLFFWLITLPALLFAQAQPERGKVEIDKDSKVDSLIGNYLLNGGKSNPNPVPAGAGGIYSSDGYRIQIFSGSDRKEAYSVQAKFQDKHPQVHTYLTYREPNFKVHIGDFRSRLEAEKMVDDLKNSFTNLFIVSEKINATKLDTE